MDLIVGIIVIGGVYLIPLWVAWLRHHQTGMVAILNVFLGWTLIGWVVALAIACGDREKHRGVTVGS
jgi:hypothetical protein